MLSDEGAKATHNMILDEIRKQKEALKEKAKEDPTYKPTRRDIRANREMQKLKDRIN